MEEFIQGLSFKWQIKKIEKEKIQNLSNQLNLSNSIIEILYKRGFENKEKIQDFLFFYYDEKFYHTSKMEDSEGAVERIIKAINEKESILICGDYDVDGISSTSLLLYSLLMLEANVNFFLPHRVLDGYGLSKKTIEKAIKNKYKLIITVDNGISAIEPIKLAKENGIDVIITDHHQPGDVLPNADFIVNPHKKTCNYPFKELAGVGVIFKIICLLFEKLNKSIPNKIYEFLLLGTVADMVPLIEENRFLIKNALNILNNNKSYPIQILSENAKIKPAKRLTASDIGFSIAPQLNALGRLENPRDGVLFFINTNKKNTEDIGKNLLDLNEQRKKIEKEIFNEIQKELKFDEKKIKEDGCILRYSNKYLPGIIGLVASKICQYYNLPTCIFNENSEGILKGSFRSIPEINIFEVLSKIDKNLILSFGGHSGAAGISIKKENFESFKEKFSETVNSICDVKKLESKVIIDGSLDIEEINKKLWNDLQLLEPFGASNPTPIFYLKDVYLKNLTILKDVHLKLTLQNGLKSCSIMFFNKPEWINILSENQNKLISVIAKVVENTWKEESKIELIGIDIKF